MVDVDKGYEWIKFRWWAGIGLSKSRMGCGECNIMGLCWVIVGVGGWVHVGWVGLMVSDG